MTSFLHWDSPENIRLRNSELFRKQAGQLAQQYMANLETMRRQRESAQFRKQAEQLIGQHREAQSFRDEAQKMIDTTIGQRRQEFAERPVSQTFQPDTGYSGEGLYRDTLQKTPVQELEAYAQGNPGVPAPQGSRIRVIAEKLAPSVNPQGGPINQYLSGLINAAIEGAPTSANPDVSFLRPPGPLPEFSLEETATLPAGLAGPGTLAGKAAGLAAGTIGGYQAGVGAQKLGLPPAAQAAIGIGAGLATGVGAQQAVERAVPAAAGALERSVAARGGLASEAGGTRLPRRPEEIQRDIDRAERALANTQSEGAELRARRRLDNLEVELAAAKVGAAGGQPPSGRPPAPPREPPAPPPSGFPEEQPRTPLEEAKQAILAGREQNVAEREAIRPQQRRETGGRIAAYEDVYQRGIREGLSPEDANRRAMGMLAGEKMKTSPVTVNLTEDQKLAINQAVETHDFGRGLGPDYERMRVRRAFGAMQSGERVREGDWISVEKVLGEHVTSVLKQANKQRVQLGFNVQTGLEVALIPKAILSAFDVSYPLRQGIMLGPRHLEEFIGNIKPALKAWASEDYAQAVQRSILDDQTPIPLADGSTITFGQYADDTGLIRTLDTGLETSEEAFQSNLAERFPGIGRFVRASNRSFTTYGNKLRADVSRNMIKAWQGEGTISGPLSRAAENVPGARSVMRVLGGGTKEITEQELQALSDMLNRFSGRGTLVAKERLTGLAKDFNNFAEAVFWAPKYRVSGPQAAAQMFNWQNPRVAREAIQNFGAFVAAGTGLLAMAQLAGLKVTLDPRSTDFGKVVGGNQRFNFWGTNQLLARTFAQIATGQKIDPDTGIPKPTDSTDLIWRYVRSGLAPEWSAIVDLIEKETYIGQPFPPTSKGDIAEQIKEKIMPLFFQDVYDTAVHGDWRTLPIVAPTALFGGSFQAYEQSASGKLDAVQQFKGIDEKTQYEVTRQGGFLDQVSAERKRLIEQEGVPKARIDAWPVADTIIQYGEKQGLPKEFIQAALYLNSQKWRQENTTDEWYKFVIENEDALREERPQMFSGWLDEFLNRNRRPKASGE